MAKKNQLLSIAHKGVLMIVSAIFKAIIFYILFITIRGAIRALGNYSKIKEQLNQAKENYQNQYQSHQQNSQKQNHAGGDVIEADYKVLD